MDIDLQLGGLAYYLKGKLEECYYPNSGKSRAGSTPYASKRKKKRKK